MAKKIVIGIGLLGVLGVGGVVGLRAYRGPTGETSNQVPEFPSLEPARWKNGEPLGMAASRGEVVFLEGWSPT